MKNLKTFTELVAEILPMVEDHQGKLVGGFSQSSSIAPDELPGINGNCPSTTNSGCNTVAGCGSKPAN